MRRDVEELLDTSGDAYLNKHFMFATIDLIVVHLFPEMLEQGVAMSLSEKLGQG